jgi:hypothetical protein
MKKTFLTFSLFAGIASAQLSTNVPTVTLSGDVHNPTITNRSGKQVIAAQVIRQLADGTHTVSQRLFTHEANVLPDGGSTTYGEYSRRVKSPEVSAKITAVIFADGEFRGEDSYGFQTNIERHLQDMRQVWQTAKAGDWAKLKSKVDANAGSDDTFGIVLAMRLLAADATQGDVRAVESFSYVGNLPASTCKGGLLNKLRVVPDVFQALAEVDYTVYAQSGPFYCASASRFLRASPNRYNSCPQSTDTS